MGERRGRGERGEVVEGELLGLGTRGEEGRPVARGGVLGDLVGDRCSAQQAAAHHRGRARLRASAEAHELSRVVSLSELLLGDDGGCALHTERREPLGGGRGDLSGAELVVALMGGGEAAGGLHECEHALELPGEVGGVVHHGEPGVTDPGLEGLFVRLDRSLEGGLAASGVVGKGVGPGGAECSGAQVDHSMVGVSHLEAVEAEGVECAVVGLRREVGGHIALTPVVEDDSRSAEGLGKLAGAEAEVALGAEHHRLHRLVALRLGGGELVHRDRAHQDDLGCDLGGDDRGEASLAEVLGEVLERRGLPRTRPTPEHHLGDALRGRGEPRGTRCAAGHLHLLLRACWVRPSAQPPPELGVRGGAARTVICMTSQLCLRLPALVLAVLLATITLATPSAAQEVSPSPTASPAPPGREAPYAERDWLQQANFLRSLWSVQVPELTEDPELSRKAGVHEAYLDATSTCSHHEDPTSPHYSEDGQYGGTHSVLWCGDVDGASAVTGWVETPLHGEQVVNPGLTITGFSDRGGHTGMDTLTHHRGAPLPGEIATWPAGSAIPVTTFSGLERPDPLVGCPQEFRDRKQPELSFGDEEPGHHGLGTSLFASFPQGPQAAVRAGLQNLTTGAAIPVCALPVGGEAGTFLLSAMIPLTPLGHGQRYEGFYETASAGTARWDFQVAKLPVTLSEGSLEDGRIAAGVPVGLSVTGAPAGGQVSLEVRYADAAGGFGPWSTLPTSEGYGDERVVVVSPGEMELRLSYSGDAQHEAATKSYALQGGGVVPSVRAVGPGQQPFGTTQTIRGYVGSVASMDDSSVRDDLGRVQLWVRGPSSTWSLRASRRVGESFDRSTAGPLGYATPGSQYQIRYVHEGQVLAHSPVHTVAIKFSVTGWPYGKTLRAPKSYVDRRAIQVRPRPGVVVLQWRASSAAGWTSLKTVPVDASGWGVVTSSNRSGQFRLYIPAAQGFLATGTGVYTQQRY